MSLCYTTRKNLTCPTVTSQMGLTTVALPGRPFSLMPFASLSLSQMGTTANLNSRLPTFASISAPLPTVTEPKTGLKFDGEFCLKDSQKNCPKLTGLGFRVKNIAGIKVKVYAAGIYIDNSAAKSVLGKYKSLAKTNKVNSSSDIFNDVIDSKSLEKTVQLVFARNVKGTSIRDALNERMKPKVGGTKEFDEFQKYFDGVKLKKGEKLSFSADNGLLTTKYEGKTLGCINSSALCEAIFDVYLGADPVSKELKDDVGAGITKLLS